MSDSESSADDLPPVATRFLRYVRIETTADPSSKSCPSSPGQLELGRLLAYELTEMGLTDVLHDQFGYVYATVPASATARTAPVIGLLAHLDTSPDASGTNVRPIVHRDYDGSALVLPGDATVILDPAQRPALLEHIGEDIITSDGTTLLGSDDKAGVAVLMQLASDLVADDQTARPTVRIVFTVDEEIGRGVDHLDLKRFGAGIAYTLDGSGVDRLYADTFNAARAVVRIRGVMTHPGYAKGIMENAVEIGCSIVNKLPSDETPSTTEGSQGYYYVQSFRAETSDAATLTVLLRDFDEDGMQRRKESLAGLVESHRTRYPESEITLDISDQYRNMRRYIEKIDRRAIDYAIEAGRELGIELVPERIRGGTDGARLSEMGIPTPNVFDGGRDYHSVYEWNTVQNLERSLAFTKALLGRWTKANNR